MLPSIPSGGDRAAINPLTRSLVPFVVLESKLNGGQGMRKGRGEELPQGVSKRLKERKDKVKHLNLSSAPKNETIH